MHRGNRHGRSEQARQAVLEAADDLLVEKGFAQLTIEGIAQRAGVAKQTIYRWWPSKTDVLFDAFLLDAAEEIQIPATGDMVEDWRGYLRSLARFLTSSDAGVVFRTLLAESQHDPALAARLREMPLPVPAAPARPMPGLPDSPVAEWVDRLVGPIYYRALVTGADIPDDFVDRLVTATLRPSSPA